MWDSSECTLIFSGIFDLNSHIETQHNKSDDVIQTTVMDEVVKCGKMIRTNTGVKRHTELYFET